MVTGEIKYQPKDNSWYIYKDNSWYIYENVVYFGTRENKRKIREKKLKRILGENI